MPLIAGGGPVFLPEFALRGLMRFSANENRGKPAKPDFPGAGNRKGSGSGRKRKRLFGPAGKARQDKQLMFFAGRFPLQTI